jgi:hypothetical protein
MNHVTPLGYIFLDDALLDLITSDIEWLRIYGRPSKVADGPEQEKAAAQEKQRVDLLHRALLSAIINNELTALALRQGAGGDWHVLPEYYWREMEKRGFSLWVPSVRSYLLREQDEWIRHAPLLFQASDWKGWKEAALVPGALEKLGKQQHRSTKTCQPLLLRREFEKYVEKQRSANALPVTLGLTWAEMKKRVSPAVTRATVDALIKKLPQEQRASTPGRPRRN